MNVELFQTPSLQNSALNSRSGNKRSKSIMTFTRNNPAGGLAADNMPEEDARHFYIWNSLHGALIYYPNKGCAPRTFSPKTLAEMALNAVHSGGAQIKIRRNNVKAHSDCNNYSLFISVRSFTNAVLNRGEHKYHDKVRQ